MKTPLMLFVNKEPGLLSGVPGSLRRSISMRVCEVEDCGRKHYGAGMCSLHYQRSRKGTQVSRPVVERHGKRNTREYCTWDHMVQRCTNPKNTNYKNYGGRGIKVCDRWLKSFQAFLEDMGKRPEGMTLDRIDNSLGYFKANCRWADRATQSMNRRPKPNVYGHSGIYPSGSKWRASFRNRHLGNFSTKIQASDAYQSARSEYLEGQFNV